MPYSLYCRARAVMRQRFGVVPLQESLPDVADWLETPLGQAVLEQERMLLEQELQDLFGYHLLQMSVDPALDLTREIGRASCRERVLAAGRAGPAGGQGREDGE